MGAALAISSALFASPLLAQPSLSIAGTSVTEGNGDFVQAVVTVTLTPASSEVVTVNFESSAANPPATGGAFCGEVDFVNPVGTLRFDPGDVSRRISVTLCSDITDEPDEKFRVRLAGAVGATIATSQGTVTILDDDAPANPLPTISIGNLTQVEGEAGIGFRVFLSPPSIQPVTVTFRTERVTANAGRTCFPDGDYEEFPPRPTIIPPGTPIFTFGLQICDDSVEEPDETFRAFLSNPIGVILGDSVGQGTIIDDDGPLPTLSIGDVTPVERNASLTTTTFTVSLSFPPRLPVTFTFRTEPTTATQGSFPCGPTLDYVKFGPFISSILPGAQSASFTVQICGDTVDEPDETFRAVLSNPIGAILGDSVGQATIIDDDVSAPPPAPPTRTLTITPLVSVTEPRRGAQGFAVFSVTLSGPTATVTVQFATAPGTARGVLASCLLAGDYLSRAGTLTFSPGIRTRELSVPICSDRDTEGPETFTVTLTNPVNATIATATGTATIRN